MSVDSEYIDPGEQILFVIRKHWVNLAPILFAWAIVGLAILFGFYSVGRFADTIAKFGPVSSLVLALGALSVLWVALVYLSFWVYMQNRLILTDKNFIQVNRAGILQANVTQFPLGKVQDVTVQQHGLFPNLLKYGDIIIETAGELPNLTFRQVANPNKVADQIMDLHEQVEAKNPTAKL
jgi:hypothetical protein